MGKYVIKRVHFADPLVSEIKTRPRTSTDDIPKLFYDARTLAQFRKDYKLSMEGYYQDECESSQHLNRRYKRGNRTKDVSEMKRVMNGDCCSDKLISKVEIVYRGQSLVFDKKTNDSRASNQQGMHLFDNDAFWNGSIKLWF